MWIDYLIGVIAVAIVVLVVSRFIINLRKRKNSNFSCNGNCSHCKYNNKK